MLLHFSRVQLARDEPDFIFAGSRPFSLGDVLKLVEDHGIKHIINLTPDVAYPVPDGVDLTLHRIPIMDFHPPTIGQMHQFVGILRGIQQAGQKVYVHCHGGIGRTGTMLACWILANDPGLDAKRAIETIREMRPPSIETSEQEQAIIAFSKVLRKQ